MKKAYDLLRRLRADNRNVGRPEERLHDWTERATKLYRDALKALERARSARPTSTASPPTTWPGPSTTPGTPRPSTSTTTCPPPPDAGGPEDEDERTRRDLRHAYDRISELKDDAEGPEIKFYLDASKDLYNAARRDAVAGRRERAGELARAAEALTHVPEHLARADSTTGPSPRRRRPRRTAPSRPRRRKADPNPRRRRTGPSPRRRSDRPEPGGEFPPPID